MKRVMIIGQPGSGKSTLARKLGARTGLPVVHIDHIHWAPGWVERPRDEKTRRCAEVHARPEWIFEGGHSATWRERLSRADTVIWLDVPLGLRFWRVIRRSALYWGRSRPDMPEGCPEQFNLDFFRFIWRTRHTSRQQIQHLIQHAPAEKQIHVLRSLGDVQGFLNSLPPAEAVSSATGDAAHG
ncbi:AAA family ATPase [Epibacterium sp. MM17-32]|uniref:AAA family ATPase n=1 Tax=Epibacterium sp. MM17-32 TaxID=2917734 RepID=UPI001EF3D833|nr:AAA family ATPase [Epibacterium sp. MM17-32]MCG7629948.1 AAA family ATPase [Epibacterium sp. MM17-32]